ncbi:MAG: sigma-70 family RNA polymerase sigma factor [bacterium]|nr:sigma-70 family RNA polymerase sigma factor [bacterium]
MTMTAQSKLKDYIDIIQKVAKVEYRRIPSHMVECEELVSIGIIAIQALIKNKTDEQLEKYNSSYIATAVRWAIRNELRNRYKWYTLKHKKESEDGEGEETETQSEGVSSLDVSPTKVREAIYETILSIDSIASASSDNDSPFDFIKDTHATPDENAEITELGRIIREAIAKLPQKDRTIVEYRFYRNMQVKQIAQMVGLSSSRITRIVQSSLNTVREYLEKRGLSY